MKKIPLITIIGVPNTGKSTLFNKLIGKKKALIHSQPGMTRDIFKHHFVLNKKQYDLQDSGGYFEDQAQITEEINKRIFIQAEKSDLILFLFDGKRDLLGYEKELFLTIKKMNSNIISVINKVDNVNRYILPDTYYALKQDFVYIAAEHSQGFEDLLDLIESRIDYKKFANAPLETQSVIRISIVGKPNVGKSSIINAILREDFSIVSPVPGTTRDSVDIEFVRNQQHFILVDNAGIRKLQKLKEDTESAAVIRAEKAIKQADIVIFAVDISKRLDQNDLLIANKVIDSYKPVIIAGNKWDLVENKNSAEKITQFVKNKLNHLYFAPIVHLSALSGKNVMSLIDYSESIFKKLATPIKTVHVNNVIKPVIKQSKLHTQEGKIFNPKYLTIESGNPIFVKFYATHAAKLKPQDERFLKKQICDLLGLEGIPVFFKIVGKSESNTNKS